jgi:hypothetical protein
MRFLACCTGLLALAVAGIGAAGLSASTTAEARPDIPVSSLLFSHSAKLTKLRPNVTYGASRFPVTVRLRTPDATWSGAQWRTGRLYPALAESRGIADDGGPPYFGWVSLAHAGASPGEPPLGLVTVMTAYAQTPSVAATVANLRTRGRGATYGPPSRVTVAGFDATQFDGAVVGPRRDHIGHVFVPFTPSTTGAHWRPDEYPVYGDVFRIDVLNVYGKTVVVIAENVALPADRFPAFLSKADLILRALRFQR